MQEIVLSFLLLQIKRSIRKIRENVTDYIFRVTKEMDYLEQVNWTKVVRARLREFENDLLWAMTKDGWDGIEDTQTIQWTFAGALFYSIIVITTIGKYELHYVYDF